MVRWTLEGLFWIVFYDSAKGCQCFFSWLMCHFSTPAQTKHLKTSSAYHASQHEVLTSACLQLSAGAIFSQAFMSSVKNRTDTHVTDTCVIHFTNLCFSRAWITLRCGWMRSKVTQNDSRSLWNKAYLGLLFRPCCQWKLRVFGLLFAQLTLICSNNGTGLWWRLFIGCQGLRSSRGSSAAACFTTFTQQGRKQPSLLISTTLIDSQFCFYARRAPFPNSAVNANLFHPPQPNVCLTFQFVRNFQMDKRQ